MKPNLITSLIIAGVAGTALLVHGDPSAADQIKTLEAQLAQLRAQAGLTSTPSAGPAVRGVPADVHALLEAMQRQFVYKHGESSVLIGQNRLGKVSCLVELQGNVQLRCVKTRAGHASEAARLNGEAEEVWGVWWDGATVMREIMIDSTTGVLDSSWTQWVELHADTRLVNATITRTNGVLAIVWNPDGYQFRPMSLEQSEAAQLLREALRLGK